MSDSSFKKYSIMFSKVDDKTKPLHPHVIVAEIDGKYVSVSLTSNSHVKGKKVVELHKNPRHQYLVTSKVYVRPKSDYFVSRRVKWGDLDPRDKELIDEIVAKAKIHK